VPKKVLIVDDERLLARTLANTLREAGYQTTVAETAETAERHLAGKETFELIVLDNRLPRRSGLDVLRGVREAGFEGKVILMTAYDSREVQSEARRLKVDRYVKKPFDLGQMMSAIRDLIGDSGSDAVSSE
jgi:DNA-binding response OmpR family regulator